MPLASMLAIIAASMHVAAVYFYNRNMTKGGTLPNPATWTLWTVLSTLNCVTYLIMTEDVIKSALPLVSTVVTLVIFINAIRFGKFKRLDKLEKTALVLGLVGAAVWLVYGSAVAGNMLLQIPIIISFVPTYRGVLKDATVEEVLPWYLWSGAYVFSITSIVLLWVYEPKPMDSPLQLVYPILCLVLHGGVGLIVQIKRSL